MQFNRFSKTFQLGIDHVDMNERMTLSAVMAAMQSASDPHATLLGLGKEQVALSGWFWVMARVRIEMLNYPLYGQNISIETWPGQREKVFFPRYFRLSDEAGNACANITALYLLINTATRRIVPAIKADIYPPALVIPDESFPAPGRLNNTAAGLPVLIRKPLYSDIDSNRHMSNVRYAQWICDLFSCDHLSRCPIGSLQINFISEAFENHSIALFCTQQDNGFTVTGLDEDGSSRVVFEALGQWLAPGIPG